MTAAARPLCVAIAVGVLGVAGAGCRVSEADVKRWETTQRGPYKLVAVVTHDKYDVDLRTEAAMSLIRMPARGGVRQGIRFLVDRYKDEDGATRDGALGQLSEEERREIVDRMAPLLIEQLAAEPPARTPEGHLPPDPSIPYKDAAFALLIHEPPLVSNEETKGALRAALMTWAQTGFEDRVENGAQQYGLEQMMRTLGADSVRVLPTLVSESTARLDRLASIVKDIGDEPTKVAMSRALVTLAERYDAPAWREAQTKIVKEHNAKNDQKADDAQVAAQVDKIQERRLTEELFPAMKRVAGKPAVDYLVGYASDPTKPAERRALALAGLEANLDKNDEGQLERIFAIAKSDDAPDVVRDGAFRRLGEFSKERIVPKLYTLSAPAKWKVRWVAFETALSTMGLAQLPEFMGHLPKTSATKMGMTEPLTYAAVIRERMEGDATAKRDALTPYLSGKDLGPKLVALGYFWEGKKADVPLVQPYAEDRSPLPKCEKEDDCSWSCDVPRPDAPSETVATELETVGDLVKLCLIPTMQK